MITYNSKSRYKSSPWFNRDLTTHAHGSFPSLETLYCFSKSIRTIKTRSNNSWWWKSDKLYEGRRLWYCFIDSWFIDCWCIGKWLLFDVVANKMIISVYRVHYMVVFYSLWCWFNGSSSCSNSESCSDWFCLAWSLFNLLLAFAAFIPSSNSLWHAVHHQQANTHIKILMW